VISNGTGCDTVREMVDKEPSLPENAPLLKLTK